MGWGFKLPYRQLLAGLLACVARTADGELPRVLTIPFFSTRYNHLNCMVIM